MSESLSFVELPPFRRSFPRSSPGGEVARVEEDTNHQQSNRPDDAGGEESEVVEEDQDGQKDQANAEPGPRRRGAREDPLEPASRPRIQRMKKNHPAA